MKRRKPGRPPLYPGRNLYSTTIYLDRSQGRALARLGARLGVTMGVLMRDAAAMVLAKHNQKG